MSLQEMVLGASDRVGAALGLLDRPFSAERMMAQARRRTGLADFGAEEFVDPLRRLLDSCAREAELSVVGRIATDWDVARFLGNLLRMRQAETAEPTILQEPIAAPVFITGLPRSGTSFLHRLIMQDPDAIGPAVWQTIYPYDDRPDGPDRRVERVSGQLRQFEKLAPEFRALHPLDATSPQECSEITAHVFASLRFDSNYRVPTYRAWLDGAGHLTAYRFHRRFLQHLQFQRTRPGRWVLKCPDHVFALDEIRAVYPDARVVFVHRDPVKVLESVTRLTEVVRRPFTRRLDRGEIGRQESARWLAGTDRMVAAADAAGAAAPIHHVHHGALVADPLGTVAALYDLLGWTLSAAAEDNIRRWVRERPNGGYGARSYRLEAYGLDPAAERSRFAGYMRRFDIAAVTDERRAQSKAPGRPGLPLSTAPQAAP